MATGNPIEPIHQFEIVDILPLGNIGGANIAFTNSGLFMVLTVAAIGAFLIFSSAQRAIVPGRWQLLAEMSHEFVANIIRSTAGSEGMKFFPLIFSLFMFVLFANLWGMIPYFFTVTSHIVITMALALLVFGTVIIYGFWRNGFKFLKLFVPTGVPMYILPLVTLIEVISFLSRPLSLSLRLFGNIMAGHIVLKVFGGMVVALLAAGGWAALAIGPFVMAVAITGLEFLVAALQAYVFAVLASMYLNDAIHPGH
ncbi:MAG TPA: F0F1 ATP synthase subunit A [Devosia sp.]|nr:F0F1 ATP synthase subunit A [Devosia sp.]